MRNLTKVLAAGTVLIALGGAGAVALAETAGPGFPQGMMGHHRHGFGDPTARLASVKTELGITAQQSTAWDAYAKVVLDTATAMRASHEKINPDAIRAMSNQDRANFLAAQWDQRDKARATVKAAADTLLASLDDTQKIKAHYVLPGLVQRGDARMMHHGMGGMMGGFR